jgi:hypothetical protein
MSNGGGFRVVGGGRSDPRGFLDVRRRADLRRTDRKKDSFRPRAPAPPATPGHPPVWESLEFSSRVARRGEPSLRSASRLMASPDSSPSRASSSPTLLLSILIYHGIKFFEKMAELFFCIKSTKSAAADFGRFHKHPQLARV